MKGADLLEEKPPSSSGLGAWYANLLMIDRRKCVLFTSEKTLYSFLVLGVKKADFKRFDELFTSNLRLNLENEGFREDVIEKVMGDYDRIDLGKTRDRSILGSMNDHAYHYKFYIHGEGGLSSCDILSLNKKINRTPMGALGYNYGIEEIRYLLGDRKLMDQELRRIEYRHGMLAPGVKSEELPIKVWEAEEIPFKVKKAIKDEDILNIAGFYEAMDAGDPVEYDHLKLILTDDVVEIEFFNREFTQFTTDDEKVRRIHRVLSTLTDKNEIRIVESTAVSRHKSEKSKIIQSNLCPCGSGKKYKKCCLSKSSPTPGWEDSIRSRLVRDILAFAKKRYGILINGAYEYFWDDFDPKIHLGAETLALAEINFLDWLVHDWRPEKDGKKTLTALYMEKGTVHHSDEKAILARMNDSIISLYEVQELLPEEGLLLKDLLLGDEYNVREQLATRSLRKWDIFATRLLKIDGNHIMTGSTYLYPQHCKESIIKRLKRCFKACRNEYPENNMRYFLKHNSDLFNHYWCENILEPFRPTLVTTTGERMIISNGIFEIKDKGSVLDGLRNIKEFHEVEERRFHWLDDQKDNVYTPVLGIISIKNKTLWLECNSAERLEKGKALLLEHLDGFIAHKVDTLQDPYQAMKRKPTTLQKEESRFPKELEQVLYTKYMREHYENWLNEKIPALHGATPLETVSKPWGKKKIIEFLKSIENMEEHKKQQGEPYCDMLWLWERLGIER